GRLEAGIGAGWMKTDYDSSGITYDPPAVRVARLEESVAILKSLWSTGTATISATHYRVSEAVRYPPPVSSPHPKPVIGGGSRREVAEQMAPTLGLEPDEALEMLPVLVGTVDELCEILLQRRQDYGFSYIVIHEGEMEDFAPVVARLAGT